MRRRLSMMFSGRTWVCCEVFMRPHIKSRIRAGGVLLSSKSEARNTKQFQMPQEENSKRFDLEDRTFAFAKSCRAFTKNLSKTIGNIQDTRQTDPFVGICRRELNRSERSAE